ncbi:hypothetical protein L8O25_18800 [Enterobacter asburiae]|uniref:hypothetical protein n=1 Tax=Enterobacter asburiae TaxID=61645 RepID=UPI0020058D1A|nr:hypothetical protein [Enterobacter asburiae]MCK7264750.1 hypothetical protein [Enterobacter asburiae]
MLKQTTSAVASVLLPQSSQSKNSKHNFILIGHWHPLVAFLMRIARAHQESLSVVSLGKPLTFGGFAVRQAHA